MNKEERMETLVDKEKAIEMLESAVKCLGYKEVYRLLFDDSDTHNLKKYDSTIKYYGSGIRIWGMCTTCDGDGTQVTLRGIYFCTDCGGMGVEEITPKRTSENEKAKQDKQGCKCYNCGVISCD